MQGPVSAEEAAAETGDDEAFAAGLPGYLMKLALDSREARSDEQHERQRQLADDECPANAPRLHRAGAAAPTVTQRVADVLIRCSECWPETKEQSGHEGNDHRKAEDPCVERHFVEPADPVGREGGQRSGAGDAEDDAKEPA